MSIEQKITAAWYGDKKWIRLLSPLSAIYRAGLDSKRAKATKALAESQVKLTTPVLVIGNITVGGTGKTPFIIFLCRYLSEQGVRVGVISRGYGGGCKKFPHEVKASDNASLVGDEPALIARLTNAKVVIDPDRYSAAGFLNDSGQVDIILSDDGMQHFGLPRDAEIVLVDAARELGNELLLPAGPLREPVEKLNSVDLCLLNGVKNIEELHSNALRLNTAGHFQLVPSQWFHISSGEQIPLDKLPESTQRVAIAGIGNPERFFVTLRSLGITADYHPLNDHQPITLDRLDQIGMNKTGKQILMTMKDAVKCQQFVNDNCWALGVGVQMEKQTEQKVMKVLSALL